MANFPYISGAGNISTIISFLRKNFPSSVTADTIKKYQIAPNNESYVINTLQFLGLLDAESKKTQLGTTTFTIHSDDDFSSAFSEIVRSVYKELFELHGENAWSLEKNKLIGYFRQADKTSDIIGQRQAAVFQVLAGISGKIDPSPEGKKVTLQTKGNQKSKSSKIKVAGSKPEKLIETKVAPKPLVEVDPGVPSKSVSLNVRIEVNLPSGAPPETYDSIFKSIREHLMND